jgi:hypothetical protein
MRYQVKYTTQFKKDLKLAKKQGKNLDALFAVVECLASGGTVSQLFGREHGHPPLLSRGGFFALLPRCDSLHLPGQLLMLDRHIPGSI